MHWKTLYQQVQITSITAYNSRTFQNLKFQSDLTISTVPQALMKYFCGFIENKFNTRLMAECNAAHSLGSSTADWDLLSTLWTLLQYYCNRVTVILQSFWHYATLISFVYYCGLHALTLLVGRQEGHSACKKPERWSTGMVVCLKHCSTICLELSPCLHSELWHAYII